MIVCKSESIAKVPFKHFFFFVIFFFWGGGGGGGGHIHIIHTYIYGQQ